MAHRAHHVGGFARLAGAIALLAVVFVGTVRAVDRGSKEADDRREDDRVALAAAFAGSVNEWLDMGVIESQRLSTAVGTTSGPDAAQIVSSFVTQPNAFTRNAMVFSGQRVIAATGRYGVLVGLAPKPCNIGGVNDDALSDLVTQASARATPVVSPIFDVPGDCQPVVAVASAAGGAVSVVLGDPQEAANRLSAAAKVVEPNAAAPAEGRDVAPGGTRVFLVTGALSLDPASNEEVVGTPPRVLEFANAFNADGTIKTRYRLGDAGGAEVLAVAAKVSSTAPWVVVLEQDAAVFDLELQNRPSVVVASVLTVVFAIVFGLLLYFDLRRSRERRRTDLAKNAFFSIAGHELRTPLTSIKGFAETLSANWEPLTDERRRQLVDRIVPQTRRLDRLVERLLVAASIQADTHARPQVRDIDPLPVMETVAEQFRGEAPLHNFYVSAVGDPGYVHADPRALDQILQHLVDNAVKYSPSGGRVRLRVGRRDGSVHILVEDDGIGLPSDHRHIFDKFVQGEAVTTRTHDEGGVGLGLFIVRTLVEDMGGTVGAEQLEDGGARFIVSLRPAEAPKPKSPLGSVLKAIRRERPGQTVDAVGVRSD